MRDKVAHVRFGWQMVPEVHQGFWEAMARGEFLTGAAEGVGTYRQRGRMWLRACGGVRPRRGRNLKGRCLSFAEREEIALRRARGEGVRAIAAVIGRSPATVSRELRRNADPRGGYRGSRAHAAASQRASRPKESKLATNQRLRDGVEADLENRRSPEQIAGRLKRDFPDEADMQVHHETIYEALYIHSRGALRRELTRRLRTGRNVRKPGRTVTQRKNRIPDPVSIRERPPEVEDRMVPGHWESALIIGRRNVSAIGTLVERHSNYTMLVHLPDGCYTPR